VPRAERRLGERDRARQPDAGGVQVAEHPIKVAHRDMRLHAQDRQLPLVEAAVPVQDRGGVRGRPPGLAEPPGALVRGGHGQDPMRRVQPGLPIANHLHRLRIRLSRSPEPPAPA
jgi:hypothetical protein